MTCLFNRKLFNYQRVTCMVFLWGQHGPKNALRLPSFLRPGHFQRWRTSTHRGNPMEKIHPNSSVATIMKHISRSDAVGYFLLMQLVFVRTYKVCPQNVGALQIQRGILENCSRMRFSGTQDIYQPHAAWFSKNSTRMPVGSRDYASIWLQVLEGRWTDELRSREASILDVANGHPVT